MYVVPTIIVWLGVTVLCLLLWNVSGQGWMSWVTLVVFLGLGVNAAVRWSKWTTTSFTVTNDRIMFRQGMIGKSGVEIPLERIMNVNFKQSIWERMIGAGDLLIESGGKDGQSRFSDVRKPELVAKEIHEQANQYEEKPARRAAAAAGAGAAAAVNANASAASAALGAEPGAERHGRAGIGRRCRAAREAARPAHQGCDHAGRVRLEEGRAAQPALGLLHSAGRQPRPVRHRDLARVGRHADRGDALLRTSRAAPGRRHEGPGHRADRVDGTRPGGCQRRGEPQGGLRRARARVGCECTSCA